MAKIISANEARKMGVPPTSEAFIEMMNKDIKEACEKGKRRTIWKGGDNTPISGFGEHDEYFRKLFLEQGYKFTSGDIIGGVVQITVYINW